MSKVSRTVASSLSKEWFWSHLFLIPSEHFATTMVVADKSLRAAFSLAERVTLVQQGWKSRPECLKNKVPLNSQPDSPISSHFYSPASDSIAIALNWVTWVEFHTGIRELKGQVTRPDIREGALSETEIREPDALIIIRLPSPVKQALPPDQWGMSWTPPSANQMRVCLKL